MGTKKILVVDFDQEFLKFLSQFLRNQGFTVITATDGFAGLEMHKCEAPDLVITEAMLPKLHGFELCSRISHSASRKTPVIIVTGVYRDTVYKTEALHTFGAAAYFEKPLDPEELMVSLRKILGLPELKEEPEESFDAAILEALVSKQAAAPGRGKPAPTASVGDDVDKMLRSTLAEFGLNAGKKKDAAEAPRPAAVKIESKAARASSLPRPDRLSTEPPPPAPRPAPKAPTARTEKPRPETSAPPVKPEAAPAPPARPPQAAAAPPSRERTESFEPIPAFGMYGENRKKSVPPRIFGAIAGVLILTSATIFVLKPGKARVPAEVSVPPVVEEFRPESDPVPPPAEPDAMSAAVPKAGKKKSPGLAKNADIAGQAAPAVQDAPIPEPEDINPMAPETAPSLEIQAPETAPSQAGDAPADAGGGTEAAATEAPVERPAVTIKAGDVLPLGEVDVPPVQVKRADPIYPSAARSLGKEGSIMINFLISETGDVIQTAVIGGDKGSLGFDKAAENAVRKWKFSPAVKAGVPVRVWKSVTIGFKLKK